MSAGHAPGMASVLLAGAAAGAMTAAPAEAGRGADAAFGVPVVRAATPQAHGYAEGVRLLDAGDLAGALAAFRGGLAEEPASVDLLNAMGVAYDRMGQFELSAGYYRTALALDPGCPRTLNNRGYSLYLQGRAAEAELLLERARDAGDPQVAEAAGRVLTLIRRQAPVAEPDAPTRIAAPAAQLERLSEGEVLLVLDTPASPGAAQLAEAAALAREARPWTPPRDAAWAQDVRTPEEAPAVAHAVARAAAASAAPDASSDAVQAAAAFIEAAARRRAPGLFAAVEPFLLSAAPAMRPGGATGGDHHVVLMPAPRDDLLMPQPGPGPAPHGRGGPAPLLFDSDNHRLNVFAARLHGVEPATPVTPSASPAVSRPVSRDDIPSRLRRLQALSDRLRG